MTACLDKAIEVQRKAYGLHPSDLVVMLNSWAGAGARAWTSEGRARLEVGHRQAEWVEIRLVPGSGNLEVKFSAAEGRSGFVEHMQKVLESRAPTVHHRLALCSGPVPGCFVCSRFRIGPAGGPERDLTLMTSVVAGAALSADVAVPHAPRPLHLQLKIETPDLDPVYSAFVVDREFRRFIGFLGAHLNPFVRPLATGATWAIHHSGGASENLLVDQGYAADPSSPSEWVDYADEPALRSVAYASDADYFEALPADLAVPRDLESRWDSLARLSTEDSLRFERASAWLTRALMAAAQHDGTGVVASSIIAIECLLDPSTKKCECCGQPVHSVGERFRKFTDRYADSEDSQLLSVFKALYQLRNRVVHGGYLETVDEPLFAQVSALSGSASLASLILVRRSLRNWLADRATSAAVSGGSETLKGHRERAATDACGGPRHRSRP